MSEPTITPEVTRYTVNAIPKEYRESERGRREAGLWDIHVERTAPDRWAVRRIGGTLSTSGTWDVEPSPSHRNEAWLRAHRFDLETALRLAIEAAPLLRPNGKSPDDFVEWLTSQGAAPAKRDR